MTLKLKSCRYYSSLTLIISARGKRVNSKTVSIVGLCLVSLVWYSKPVSLCDLWRPVVNPYQHHYSTDGNTDLFCQYASRCLWSQLPVPVHQIHYRLSSLTLLFLHLSYGLPLLIYHHHHPKLPQSVTQCFKPTSSTNPSHRGLCLPHDCHTDHFW